MNPTTPHRIALGAMLGAAVGITVYTTTLHDDVMALGQALGAATSHWPVMRALLIAYVVGTALLLNGWIWRNGLPEHQEPRGGKTK